jgi:hypothetical protein
MEVPECAQEVVWKAEEVEVWNVRLVLSFR